MPACAAASSRSIGAVRMGIDPQRGFHRAAAVAQRRRHRLWRAAGDRLDKAAGKERARPRRGRYRCCHLPPSAPVRPAPSIPAAAAPRRPARSSALSPIVSTSSGLRKNDRHSSPTDVVVGADIFVAGMADQDRSRHQLVEAAAAMAAKTALAHIGDRMTVELFRKRLVARSRGAAEVGHGNVVALEKRRPVHARRFRAAGAAAQPAAARRTGSC